MTKKFEVGQVWRDGNEAEFTITDVRPNSEADTWPVKSHDMSYTLDGIYGTDLGPSSFDLVELVKNADGTPAIVAVAVPVEPNGLPEVRDLTPEEIASREMFNADAAKRGAMKVQFCQTGGQWVDVHYIGPDVVRGGHVIQHKAGNLLTTGALRTVPFTKDVFVNVFKLDDGAYIVRAFETQREAEQMALGETAAEYGIARRVSLDIDPG